ncbi:MAG: O-antigen ligase family protein [Candidatus Eisenbacteria bacterium]
MRLALVGAILAMAPGLLEPFTAAKHAVLLSGAAALAGAALAAIFVSPRAALAPRGALEWLILAWLALAAGSTLTSVSPMRSVFGELEQREGLLTLTAFGAIALASARAHPDSRAGERTLDAFLFAAAVTAAYALVQHAGHDPIEWVNPSLYPDRGGMVIRPGGSLGSALLLGMILAPALAVTLVRLLARPGRVATLGPLATLFAAATLTTLSRGAWLAAAAGAAAALTLAWGRRWARPADLLRALGFALAPAALWGAIVLRGPIVARLTEHRDPSATSGPARAWIYDAAFAIAQRHPVLGSGPDTFGLLFPQVQSAQYMRDAWVGMPVHAHSAVLQLLATLGLLGLLMGVVGLLVLGRALRSSGSGDLVASAAAAGTVALTVGASVESLGLAGVALLAVLAGLLARSRRGEDAAHPRSPSTRAAMIGSAFALLACGLAITPSLRASAAAGVARTALELSTGAPAERAPELDRGLAAAHAAANLAPWDDGYMRLASDLELIEADQRWAGRDTAATRSHAAAALTAAENAVHIEPLRATAHQRVGSAQAQLAAAASSEPEELLHTQRARTAFRKARSLAPHDPLLLLAECRAALSAHDGHWALSSAESLRALSPHAGQAWALRAAAFLSLGMIQECRDALDSAAVANWEVGSERERASVQAGRQALRR